MTHERRQIIMHRAKPIIYLDHTNLRGAEYVKVIEDSMRMARESDKSNRLILVDSTGSVVDRNVARALKRLTLESSSKISKIAVIGITGIQLIVMRAISNFSKTKIKPFKTREEALEWLTS